jgi:hypothetical protein
LQLDEAVVKAVSGLLSDKQYSGLGNVRKSRCIAKALFHDDFGRVADPFVLDYAKKWLRQNIFAPWKVLKVMDLAGGPCHYKGIGVLRSMETGGKW